ncbi:MAG: hypothetical protein U1E59_20530 [Amaricoccus sp.]
MKGVGVDGTRDRPPGKTAQIAGRRDGIRAGAVSGPWRSAPAAEPAPLRADPPRPTGAAAPLRPAALPAPADPPTRRHLEHAATSDHALGSSRRLAMSLTWVGLGFLIAAAAVVAAFLFRPSTESAAVAPGVDVAAAPADSPATLASSNAGPEPAAKVPTPATDAPAPATQAPAVAPTPESALAAVRVVRLRVGPEFAADRQSAVLAALKGAGIATVRVEPLPFKVTTSRVGYYRSADVTAAEALARLITPVVGGDAIGVRDYSQLLDGADPGRLDLWIGG